MNENRVCAIMDVYPGLETCYITPDICGHCFEHVAREWEFCPTCGKEIIRKETNDELREIRHGNG